MIGYPNACNNDCQQGRTCDCAPKDYVVETRRFFNQDMKHLLPRENESFRRETWGFVLSITLAFFAGAAAAAVVLAALSMGAA